MPTLDATFIGAALRHRMVELVTFFRGEPNRAVSTRDEIRWGRRGSLCVHLGGRRQNRWDNYETGQGGDGLDLVMAERGCSLPDALEWAADWIGGAFPVREIQPAVASAPVPDGAERSARARSLWDAAVDPRGTLVERYLQGRGLVLPDEASGRAIRFLADCPWKTTNDTVIKVAAMVCAMVDVNTNELRAVHRTALTSDGQKIGKKMLGPVAGTVIKLSPDEDVSIGLGICEGVENGLAVLQKGWRPVWALGSAGAIRTFEVLPGIDTLTVFGDHDQAGREAARVVSERWQRAGVECVIRLPKDGGTDWNDAVRHGRAA